MSDDESTSGKRYVVRQKGIRETRHRGDKGGYLIYILDVHDVGLPVASSPSLRSCRIFVKKGPMRMEIRVS